jgi:murein DD-endopeptidase MepM/ murein hydrolase activator NlpD
MVIYHKDFDRHTRYLHLNSVTVQKGDRVKEGQIIAHVGDSGRVSPHLHFEVIKPEGVSFLTRYWRRWGGYPGNKSAEWVMARFEDPEQFLLRVEQRQEPIEKKLERWMLTAPRRLPLLKKKGDPRIFMLGQDKQIYHITDMATLTALYGEFSEDECLNDEPPLEYKTILVWPN